SGSFFSLLVGGADNVFEEMMKMENYYFINQCVWRTVISFSSLLLFSAGCGSRQRILAMCMGHGCQ
ncbi:hypothetical protein, partial [Escherichia coli]|uniref:hypothetical protein n=1 Tax=Escherichia coli TaxID=562 RepID=UPI00321A509F